MENKSWFWISHSLVCVCGSDHFHISFWHLVLKRVILNKQFHKVPHYWARLSRAGYDTTQIRFCELARKSGFWEEHWYCAGTCEMYCFVNNIFNRCCFFFIFPQRWVVSGDCPCTPFSFSPHSSSFACAELFFSICSQWYTHVASSAGCPPLSPSKHTGNTQLQFVWSTRGSGSGAGSLVELLLSWPTSSWK